MIYKIGDRVRRYKDFGTVVEVCDNALCGYIVQMDHDEPEEIIMAPGYLLSPAT